jgi:hypothetical protein
MINENIREDDDNVRSQGMHLEGDAHRPINDGDAVIDPDEIPIDSIELDPTSLEGGIIDEADLPIEDGYGNGDPVV